MPLERAAPAPAGIRGPERLGRNRVVAVRLVSSLPEPVEIGRGRRLAGSGRRDRHRCHARAVFPTYAGNTGMTWGRTMLNSTERCESDALALDLPSLSLVQSVYPYAGPAPTSESTVIIDD